MILNKGHLGVAWAILDAHIDFRGDFERVLRVNAMDEDLIKRILITTDLLKTPHTSFFTRDEVVLANLISFIFFCLHKIRAEFEYALERLQSIMKAEVDDNKISMDAYIKYRRTNRELKALLDYVCRGENSTITMNADFLSAIIV
jgi:hypothetical protein